MDHPFRSRSRVTGWLVCCLAALAASPAPALDRVTLQLKWRHQFQFAGYYMALEKGYYRERRLDVRLLEAGPETDVLAPVLSGQAEFGIASSELLLARQTRPVVALAPIYQHSPVALVARADRAGNLHELVGQPIMLEPGSAEILGLFQQEGVPLAKLDIRAHPFDLGPLLRGEVSAISVYSTTEPYLLRQAGLVFNEFSARAAGIDFYGDILFTSESESRARPERVRAFLDASLQGWGYAMQHVEETIDLILAKYDTQGRSRDAYRFEAEESRRLMQPDLVTIGHVNPGRWRHIADTYAALGMLPPDFPLEGFIYAPSGPPVQVVDPRLLGVLLVVLAVALVLGLLSARVVVLNRRLRAEMRLREEVDRRLLESEALYRLLTENSRDVIWMLDLATRRFDYISPAIERLLGFSAAEVMGQTLEETLTEASLSRAEAMIRETSARLLAGDAEAAHAMVEMEQLRKDGSSVQTEVVASYLLDETGHPVKLLGVSRDISRRRALEAESRRRLAAIEATVDAIAITDREGYLLYVNPAFAHRTGYAQEAIQGLHTRVLKSGRHDRAFYERLWNRVLAGEVWRGEIVNRRKDGTLFEEEMIISPVKNARGAIDSFVAVKRDISAQRAMEHALQSANRQLSDNLEKIGRLQAELAEQVIRDPLTGLHNRRYLDETLPSEFARARHAGYPLVVAMLDVDHFKGINDRWGHVVGDEVLRALAALLREHFREGDIVCRYGGEEFLLLMPQISLELGQQRLEDFRRLFADLLVCHGETRIRATVSVGMAVLPDTARTCSSLVEQADAALYRAKRGGRNRSEVAPLLG